MGEEGEADGLKAMRERAREEEYGASLLGTQRFRRRVVCLCETVKVAQSPPSILRSAPNAYLLDRTYDLPLLKAQYASPSSTISFIDCGRKAGEGWTSSSLGFAGGTAAR